MFCPRFIGEPWSAQIVVMKFVKSILLGFLLTVGHFAAHAAPPKLIVAITVDQLRYDYLERFDHLFTTNGFRLFLDRGVNMSFARYNYVPTVTGPGHASFLSGATPAYHGIIGNDWYDRYTRKEVYCVGDSSVSPVGTTNSSGKMSPKNFIGANFSDMLRLHYQSKIVGVSIKDRGAILPAGKKPTGAYWFESKTGNFITSSYYCETMPEWAQKFNERKRPADFLGKTWSRLVDKKHYLYPDDAPGENPLSGEKTPVFDHVMPATPQENYDWLIPSPFCNQVVLEMSIAAIEGERLGQGETPDMLCVSFTSNDSVGHRFGPYSQEVQDMTLRLDRQLNDLFNYLNKKVGLKNVMVVLSADHGISPLPEFGRQQGLDGGRNNESALLVELMGKLDEKYGPGKYFQPAKFVIGNLFLNPDTLKEKSLPIAEVSSFIREWALSTGRYQAIYTREQLLNGNAPGPIGEMVLRGYNAERSGDLVFVAKPFYFPGSGNVGVTHGSPYTYDSHIPALFYGAAFKPGRYADEFYISDIAPTLCAALGLEYPPLCLGKPFVKALAQP